VIVQKFGGTSVQDAEAIRRLGHIVGERGNEGSLVVVSACAGATNALLEVGRWASSGKIAEARRSLVDLLERHRAILADLPNLPAKVGASVEALFQEAMVFVDGLAAVGETSPRSLDQIASYGERLSSTIVQGWLEAEGIRSSLVDARSLLETDDRFTQATPLVGPTREKLSASVAPSLKGGMVVVTQGFIGSTGSGVTTTVGRGGSDYSAALFGSLLGAREIQIWTDVDGILTADPGIIPEAKRVRLMSFREASELAYFGARVLHPETIRPAVERGIPVRVLNSRRPGQDGTLIVGANGSPEGCRVKSVAYKEGITVVTVVSERMFLSHSFLEEVFNILHRHRTVVHTVAASDVSVSFTVNGAGNIQEVVADLGAFSTVTVARRKAIVAVVGERLREANGMAAKIFGTLDGENVNMISQGASEINLSFVVDEDRLQEIVRKLHRALFEDILQYPEVFG
jgi:aspartate kinase